MGSPLQGALSKCHTRLQPHFRHRFRHYFRRHTCLYKRRLVIGVTKYILKLTGGGERTFTTIGPSVHEGFPHVHRDFVHEINITRLRYG